MKLRVVHRTRTVYGEPVTTSHHEVRLTPRAGEHQHTIAHDLEIRPAPAVRRRRYDYFGNRTAYFNVSEPHTELEVTATSLVEVTVPLVPDLGLTPPWEDVRDELRSERRRDVLDALQMTFESSHVPYLDAVAAYAAPSFAARRPVLEAARDVTRRIHDDFVYDPRATDVSTPLADVLAKRRGVCQDFAHLMIGCLRALGVACGYVRGYLLAHPPPGKPRLVGADGSHAWVAVWLPRHGWVDFDPTNDVVPGEEHVTVACGRDFADVTPMRGVILGGGRHSLEVSVDDAPVQPASPPPGDSVPSL
jgi:transglutaminase-like putative cysteine protease